VAPVLKGICLAILVLFPAIAAGAEIVGRPRVIDAGTLDFSGRIVRLYGIDAPDVSQTCRADGREWPCGLEARWAAINRIGSHWVTCATVSETAEGGLAAVCYLAGLGQMDLNAWLVARGWALADPAATTGYKTQEAAARSAHKGLWKGRFVPPRDWREGRRLAP